MRETSIDVQAQLKALRLNLHGYCLGRFDGARRRYAGCITLVEHLLQAEDEGDLRCVPSPTR